MLGQKVQIMHSSREVLGKPRLLLDERLIDQQLGGGRGQLHRAPLVHLLLQRTKVPVHPVDPDGQAVFEREVLGMLRENGSVFPVKRKVLANEDSQSNGTAKPKALVMAVPQADGKSVMPTSA